MSLHSKRQQQHLLPGKHKAKEEKEVLQCSHCCSAEERRAKAETGLLRPLLRAAQRGKAGVLARLQSSPTCRSYKSPPPHPAASSLCPHLLITSPLRCPVTDSAHFNPTCPLSQLCFCKFVSCKFSRNMCYLAKMCCSPDWRCSKDQTPASVLRELAGSLRHFYNRVQVLAPVKAIRCQY